MNYRFRRYLILIALKLAGMKAATYRGTYKDRNVVILIYDKSMIHNSKHWGYGLTQHDLLSPNRVVCIDVKEGNLNEKTI